MGSQHCFEAFFESVVLDDQIADVLLFACENGLQVLNVLLAADQFLLEVLLQTHFVVTHHQPEFALLVLDGSTGLELESLDEAFLEAKLASETPVLAKQVLNLLLQFDVFVFDLLVLVEQFFDELLIFVFFRLVLMLDSFFDPLCLLLELLLQSNDFVFFSLQSVSKLFFL